MNLKPMYTVAAENIATNMLKENLDISLIARVTELSLETVRSLKEELEHPIPPPKPYITSWERRGREIGKKEVKKEVAISMIKKGMEISMISEITDFSEADVLIIKNEFERENP